MKKFYIIFGGLVVALFAMGQSSGPVEIRRGGGSSGVPTLNGTATNLQVYSSGTTNRPLRVYGTNGTTEVYVDKDGTLIAKTGNYNDPAFLMGSTGAGWSTYAGGVLMVKPGDYGPALFANTYSTLGGVCLTAFNGYFWANDIDPNIIHRDTGLTRNSAGVVEINNGTAGQYRDLKLRTLYGVGGTVTASAPVLDISQTWNNAGVNFTAAKVNVTNTASADASLLLDLQLDGTSKFSVAKDGAINFGSPVGVGAITRTGIANSANGISIFPNSPYAHFAFSGSTMSFFTIGGSVPTISFVNGGGTADAGMSRNTAGIIEINNGTVGQYRDLVTRSTFATNASITNITADSYVTTQQTLSYASATNLTVDANKSLHFVSLTNTAYFAQPSNLGVGRTFTVILQQDGTGTRAVTFNTNYWKFPGGVVPTITTNANAYDVLSCISCPYGTNVFAIHNAKFQ